MTISNVTPTKIYDEGILKAEFSITIDDCITINDIKVIQKDRDITVSLPRRRNEDGIYKEIVSPSNPEAKRKKRHWRNRNFPKPKPGVLNSNRIGRLLKTSAI